MIDRLELSVMPENRTLVEANRIVPTERRIAESERKWSHNLVHRNLFLKALRKGEKKMKKVLIALTVLGLSLCATMALAADGKVYPGVMAVRSNASQPHPYILFGAVENSSSTSALRLVLPVVHDGTTIASAWVKVIDVNSTENVCASLMSWHRAGASYSGWSSPQKCSVGSYWTTQTLTFGPLSSISEAHYFFDAIIPKATPGGRSGIISYQVNEN
jgi:hypothetical protein